MNSFTVAFVFIVICLIAFSLLWYKVFFKDGAEQWQKGILKIHGDNYRMISHPVVAKTATTLLLISFLIALVLLFFDSSYK